jgi:hypothetical protein
MSTRSRKQLSGKQLNAIVLRRLRKYDRLNFFESFAMFMGKAQLVELGLKNFLISKYGLVEEKVQNWPLGRVIAELRERGCCQDFIGLVEELKERRNHIAHELLVNDAITRRLTGFTARRIASDSVSKGLYCAEATIVVHDFLVSNGFL